VQPNDTCRVCVGGKDHNIAPSHFTFTLGWPTKLLQCYNFRELGVSIIQQESSWSPGKLSVSQTFGQAYPEPAGV